MKAPKEIPKAQRNLLSLLSLGVTLAIVTSIGGGAILRMGYSHPDVTQPIWKTGQYIMLLGLANLFVHFCLATQVVRLLKSIKRDAENQ